MYQSDKPVTTRVGKFLKTSRKETEEQVRNRGTRPISPKPLPKYHSGTGTPAYVRM